MSEFVIGRIDFEFALGTAAGESSGSTLPHPAAASAASRIAPIPDALSGIMTRTEEAT